MTDSPQLPDPLLAAGSAVCMACPASVPAEDAVWLPGDRWPPRLWASYPAPCQHTAPLMAVVDVGLLQSDVRCAAPTASGPCPQPRLAGTGRCSEHAAQARDLERRSDRGYRL